MHLEDRVKVDTPEGVSVELTLAGVGSRFLAALLDGVLVAGLLIIALIAVGAIGLLEEDPLLAVGLFAGAALVVVIGYYVGFETLNGGQTPGKRAAGLRVIKDSGAPVDMWASVVRNLARIVDLLPVAYAVGLITILSTRNNQRLGDLAAGTLVVRIRKPVPPPTLSTPDPLEAVWDVASVTAADLAVVRRFLERRGSLPPERRQELAAKIAASIAPRVGGLDQTLAPEVFLESVAAKRLPRH